MPPNASDTFIIFKPQERMAGSRPCQGRAGRTDRGAVRELPGNAYEFTQPIQMRFNELLAGVRGDVAVKVFGDEFDPCCETANQIAAILRATSGATDVKVEQTRACRCWRSRSTRRRSPGAA